ncbi:MAG: hypothetical protein KKE65_05365 [Actinobacteria bacterium]|nr:hypothetical protein [Actinomycetota bacterium]MBU2111068.1 hypothetical protein [Actinomycetota bacterium]
MSVVRSLWRLSVATALALLGLSITTAVVLAAAPEATQIYTYDSPQHPAGSADIATERGPPAFHALDIAHDAVDQWSHRDSVRLSAPVAGSTTTYDAPPTLAQVARATSTTLGQAGTLSDHPSSLQRWHVAAKTVDDLPTVNWGQQSKHFPGHPNFIPGRSTLTANPEALIQRAGTGSPVGSVPRGQAGFRERIDFGDNIGTYVSRDGTSSPTSIGILHYRADGSVHIIPGRPQ